MPRTTRSLNSDEWPTKREIAARCLALGMTQQKSADEAMVDLTTVQRWLREEPYVAHIDDLRRYGFQQVEADWIGGLRLALRCETQMFNGEIEPNDPRYIEARRRIDRFDKFLMVRPPTGAGGEPGSPLPNNNGPQLAPPTDVTPD